MELQELKSTAADLVNSLRETMAQCQSTLTRMTQYRPRISKKDPFVISFVGRFKTGKTSLLNALLGDTFLPTKATTATAVVTKIRYGRKQAAFVEEKGTLTPISMDEARQIILYDSEKEQQDLRTVVFHLPIRWLKRDVELRDTPGLDDSAMGGYLEGITMQAVAGSDLCVFVYDSSSFVSAQEVENTLTIHKLLGGNIVFSINKINLLNEQCEIDQVAQSVKRRFALLGNELIGKCRYYMMCSAPKMINLSGFDLWLKDLVNPRRWPTFQELKQIGFRNWLNKFLHAKRKKQLLQLRGTARFHKDLHLVQQHRRQAAILQQASGNVLTQLNEAHRQELERKQAELRAQGTDRIARGKLSKEEIERVLTDTSGLYARLLGLIRTENWRPNYRALSKAAVEAYYEETIRELTQRHFPDHTFNFSALTQKLSRLNFPGAKFAIFRSEQDVLQRSAARTIELVKLNYTDPLKAQFDSDIQTFLENTERNMNQAIQACQSGLEDVTKGLEAASGGLATAVQALPDPARYGHTDEDLELNM